MKNLINYLPIRLALPFFLSISCMAAETDLLLQQEGYTGKIIDAQIESIEFLDSNNEIKKIIISVPYPADQINNVEVLTKEKKIIKQKKPYEIVKDFEEGRSGIIIYFGKEQKLPFRLNFNENLDKAIKDSSD